MYAREYAVNTTLLAPLEKQKLTTIVFNKPIVNPTTGDYNKKKPKKGAFNFLLC